MSGFVNRVEGGTGSPLSAYVWFFAGPLPKFGGALPDRPET